MADGVYPSAILAEEVVLVLFATVTSAGSDQPCKALVFAIVRRVVFPLSLAIFLRALFAHARQRASYSFERSGASSHSSRVYARTCTGARALPRIALEKVNTLSDKFTHVAKIGQ